jgi:hypothetical protein
MVLERISSTMSPDKQPRDYPASMSFLAADLSPDNHSEPRSNSTQTVLVSLL